MVNINKKKEEKKQIKVKKKLGIKTKGRDTNMIDKRENIPLNGSVNFYVY